MIYVPILRGCGEMGKINHPLLKNLLTVYLRQVYPSCG